MSKGKEMKPPPIIIIIINSPSAQHNTSQKKSAQSNCLDFSLWHSLPDLDIWLAVHHYRKCPTAELLSHWLLIRAILT